MRLGIKTYDIGETGGGGTTLQRALLGALSGVSCSHELVFLQETRVQETQGGKHLTSLFHRAARRCGRAFRHATNAQPDLVGEERAIAQQNIDVVWYLAPGAYPASVPYLATVWDLEHRRLPLFPEVSTTGWKWQDRENNYQRLLPRACRVLTGTNAGKNEIVSFYGVSPDNIRVVPFPVDACFRKVNAHAENIREKYGIPGRFIFYPAQFWPHKNHVNLLLALRRYNDNHRSPLHLALTGSDKGNLDHVISTIRQLGLSEFVQILGFLPHNDLPAIFAQCEAMVFPTFFGPDNIPPLEAFAAGCPVAASRVPGAEEQLSDAAILFNPANPAEMAQAIAQIVDDPGKRSELIERGLRRVANLTPENYIGRVLEILDEIEPMRRCWGKSYAHT